MCLVRRISFWRSCPSLHVAYCTFFHDTDIDSVDPSNDLTLFANVMEAMERCSPDASIFILIHKMDLVAEDDREREFAERSALVQSKSEQ